EGRKTAKTVKGKLESQPAHEKILRENRRVHQDGYAGGQDCNSHACQHGQLKLPSLQILDADFVKNMHGPSERSFRGFGRFYYHSTRYVASCPNLRLCSQLDNHWREDFTRGSHLQCCFCGRAANVKTVYN